VIAPGLCSITFRLADVASIASFFGSNTDEEVQAEAACEVILA